MRHSGCSVLHIWNFNKAETREQRSSLISQAVVNDGSSNKSIKVFISFPFHLKL